MKRKIICLVVLFSVLATNLFADQTGDVSDGGKSEKYYMKFRGSVLIGFIYYFGIAKGLSTYKNVSSPDYKVYDYTNSGDPLNIHHNDGVGNKVGTSWGGVELGMYTNYGFIAPFLTADHFLFSGNNIKLNFKLDLTPVSINAGAEVTFTPIAFLQFNSGFLIGSGWNFFGLFNGLGRNDGTTNKGRVEPFYGPVFQTWFSSTLQFDFSYVMPKNIRRWTHIVFQATPKLIYKGLLNVSDNVAYQYEADMGENLNGWNFKGNFLLGYQIPIIEDETGKDEMFLRRVNNNFVITAAMLFAIDKLSLTHYSDSPMSGGWGSDFCYVYFGPIFNFDLPNNFFGVFSLQWANEREYTSNTVGNLFYQNKTYKDWYVYFYRIVFAFGINI